jgi:hypothetical protein
VLAVLTVGVVALAERRDRHDTVTASDTARPAGAPAELPREVEVLCDPTGIVVPVASVRPEHDGLHITVVNSLGAPTVLQVDGDGWRSGDIEVPPGSSDVRQPVPPGELTIGCAIAGEMQRRRVDLVDSDGYYQVPELSCDQADAVTLPDLPVTVPQATNIIKAARSALHPYVTGGTENDEIDALRGYQSQRLGYATDDPVVQVTRAGKVIAFVHVRGADGATSAPWTTVSEAEVCSSVLTAPPTTEATTSTTASPPVGPAPT